LLADLEGDSGNAKPEAGDSKIDAGNSKMETGNWTPPCTDASGDDRT